MSLRSESEVLAETLDFTRGLNRWYLSLLKGVDMNHRFEVNGIKLNSALWMAAHLVWAENFLILQETGGSTADFEWMKEFGFGSNPDEVTPPDIKEILNAMKTVHEASLQHIRTLTDAQLDEPTVNGVSFGKGTKREAIQHAIRHEGTHSGQLGWICKLNGIKTV